MRGCQQARTALLDVRHGIKHRRADSPRSIHRTRTPARITHHASRITHAAACPASAAMIYAMPAGEPPSQRDPLPFLLPFPQPSSTVGQQEIRRRETRELLRSWSSFFERPQVRGWLRLSGRNGCGDGSRTGIAADSAAGIRCSTIVAAEQAASVTSRWAPQDEAFAFARHGNGIFRHGMPTVCWPHRHVKTAHSASITRRAKAECESGV